MSATKPPSKFSAASYNVSDFAYAKSSRSTTVPDWECHLCHAVTYQGNADEHLAWHEDEHERLLAVAVDLLRALGGLKDG